MNKYNLTEKELYEAKKLNFYVKSQEEAERMISVAGRCKDALVRFNIQPEFVNSFDQFGYPNPKGTTND